MQNDGVLLQMHDDAENSLILQLIWARFMQDHKVQNLILS